MNMNFDPKEIVGKIKELVAKGNVSRIVVEKDGKEIVNIPVTAGVVGGVVGLAVAKWALLLAVLATVGFGCTVYVEKDDGSIVDILNRETGAKIRNKAQDVAEKVKDTVADFASGENEDKSGEEEEIVAEVFEYDDGDKNQDQ